MRGDIGMVFQENALFDSLTVAEVLGFIGLAEYAGRLPSELSGGQRRRVAIARAMAPAPGILLFDDPITALDPGHAPDPRCLLRGHASSCPPR